MHPHDRDREVLFRRNAGRCDFGPTGPCLTAPKPDREHRETEHGDDREDRKRDPGKRVVIRDQVDDPDDQSSCSEQEMAQDQGGPDPVTRLLLLLHPAPHQPDRKQHEAAACGDQPGDERSPFHVRLLWVVTASRSPSLYREAVLLSLGIPAHCAAKDREQDATITVLAPAPAGIAADLYDGGAFERTREERRPHSAVDRAELRVCPDKRAQRAGGGRDHRAVTGYLRDGRLIAEVPQSGANTGKGSPERLCGPASTLASELSTESDPDLVQALAAPVPGERIDSERDQLLVAAPGEFDGAQLRSHTIGLGRPPRSRPGSSGSPFEGGNQEPRSGEPLESTSCDVSMNLMGGSHLVRCHRQLLCTREQERLAKSPIPECVEPMHHFLETW